MFKKRSSKELEGKEIKRELEEKEKGRDFTREELGEIKTLINKSKSFNLKVAYLPRYKGTTLSSYRSIEGLNVVYVQEVSSGDKVLINFN